MRCIFAQQWQVDFLSCCYITSIGKQLNNVRNEIVIKSGRVTVKI